MRQSRIESRCHLDSPCLKSLLVVLVFRQLFSCLCLQLFTPLTMRLSSQNNQMTYGLGIHHLLTATWWGHLAASPLLFC